jgi:hypothetical protein
MRRVGAQQLEIPARGMPFGARRGGVLKLRRPRPVACDLAHQPMRGLIQIVGHLHRERAARTEFGNQRRQERLVIRDPLQHGVGEDHVGRRLRKPIANIRRLEGDVGETLARRFDHIGRGIEADDARMRVALTQHFGRIAGAAADVGGAENFSVRNLRHEIAHRPRPLVFEFEVLGGGPGHFAGVSVRRPAFMRRDP